MTEQDQRPGWDAYMEWAGRFASDPEFKRDELDYKRRAGLAVGVAVAALRTGEQWLEPLRHAFLSKNNNMVDWRSYGRFLDWVERQPGSCSEALAVLWAEGDNSGPERVDGFDAFVPDDVSTRPGGLANLAGFLLSGLDADMWPNYRISTLDDAYELARFPTVPLKSSPGAHFGHALEFFDATIAEAASRNLPIRTRLEAQSAMWVIAGPGGHGRYGLTDDERARFDTFVAIPNMLRTERKKKAAEPKKPKRPSSRVCPKCGHDDEVTFVGPAEDRWEFECAGSSQHAEPYSVLVRG